MTAAGLFVSQGINRIEKRGFIGRIKSEQHADQTGKDKRHNHVSPGNFERKRGKQFHNFHAGQSGQNADQSADQRQNDRFHQKLPANIPGFGADGHSDADFSGAFGNRNQHYVHNADSSD